MYTPIVTPNIPAAMGSGAEDLSVGRTFAEGLSSGFEHSLLPAIGRLAATLGEKDIFADIPTERGPFGRPMESPALTEEAWKTSQEWRPGVKYEPGMTDYRARLLADDHDRKEHEAWVSEHWHGAGKGAVYVLGQIAGTALDPTNYIPLFGQAALAARIGRVGASALVNAAGAAAVVGTAQVVEGLSEAQLGNDPDWMGAAGNVGIAGLFGAGLGLLAGFLSRAPIEAKVSATAKALDDLSAGRPVDVWPVLGVEADKTAKLKALLGDTALPEPLRRQVAESLGLDPAQDLLAQAERAFPESRKPDFSVAVPKETPFEELAAVGQAAAPEAGAVDIGVRPEVVARIEQRFKDLADNPATAHLTEGADISLETKGLRDRARAWTSAALCLMRETF